MLIVEYFLTYQRFFTLMRFDLSDVYTTDTEMPDGTQLLPTVHCHCPVLLELPNHELMAVWYAGKAEAHKSVGLKASWKPINGGTWSKPVIIHKTPGRADGNAVLAYYNKELYLIYNTIYGIVFPWTNTITSMKTSKDFGRTWSEPRVIVSKKGYTVRTKPLILGKKMIIPVGNEHITKTCSAMLITDDGENFRFSQEIWLPKGRNEQPAIMQLSDGSLLAYLRTHEGHIYESRSTDLGETWTQGKPLEFMNPNSALDFVRTPQGEIVLVWNNNIRVGDGFKCRRCLNVAYSKDEGKTWGPIKELERNDVDGSFAYPAIIYGSDNLFHVIFNNRRKKFHYAVFDREWLEKQ